MGWLYGSHIVWARNDWVGLWNTSIPAMYRTLLDCLRCGLSLSMGIRETKFSEETCRDVLHGLRRRCIYVCTARAVGVSLSALLWFNQPFCKSQCPIASLGDNVVISI